MMMTGTTTQCQSGGGSSGSTCCVLSAERSPTWDYANALHFLDDAHPLAAVLDGAAGSTAPTAAKPTTH